MNHSPKPEASPRLSMNPTGGSASTLSTPSSHHWFNVNHRVPSKESVIDGCLELGRDAGLGNVYHTRYRISHEQQRTGLCVDLLEEEMAPCCGKKARTSCGHMLWAIIRSEAFLFSLHMTALALGAIKEAADFRKEAETLHLVHSVIETFVSILLVVVRVISGWTAFYFLEKKVGKMERFKRDSKYRIQGRSLKRWLRLFTLGGVIIVIFLITTFFCFYFLVHLGWTVLTNQFALVLIAVMASLYMGRVEKSVNVNSEDHHKAALYESVLLLQELQGQMADSSAKRDDKQALADRISRFTKALRDTSMFEQPDHIQLSNKYKPAYSLTFNAMMQSMV